MSRWSKLRLRRLPEALLLRHGRSGEVSADRRVLAALAFAIALSIAQTGRAADPGGTPAVTPMFAAGDAIAGARHYAAACAVCHGAALQGGAGPALKGAPFVAKWLPPAHPESDLLASLARMPPATPSSFSPQQHADLARYLVEQNSSVASAPASSNEPSTVSFPTAPLSVARASGTRPDDADIASLAPSEWLVYNRDYQGRRFSPLAQINRRNVAKLRPMCLFQLGEIASFQTSPLAYEGRLYITTARNTYAIDATTCRSVWKSNHPATGPEVIPANRGVALYRGKLFRGTPDGRLLALDLQDGKVLWELRVADSARASFVSLAPIAAEGLVFVGQAGADWGANGHLHAFDAETGARAWTFDLIPTGNQPGAETWGAGSETGGGSIWSTLTYDPRGRTLYASVGNPAPDYDGAKRPGDNLYTNSVIALEARTGKLLWYVQQTPHDTRDYDTVAAPVIYEAGGKPRLAVANKGGWLYLYDRTDRKLVRREATTTHENTDVPLGPQFLRVCPGQLGGTQWNGPALDPAQGVLFVNAVDWCGDLKLAPAEYSPGRIFFGGQFVADPVDKASGWVKAFDSMTGNPLWSYHSPTPMIAGLTPTAGGIVFTGDLNGDLLAFDGKTGDILYRYNTGGPIAGGLSSYAVGGKQYLAVTSGNTGRTGTRTLGAATLIIFDLPQ